VGRAVVPIVHCREGRRGNHDSDASVVKPRQPRGHAVGMAEEGVENKTEAKAAQGAEEENSEHDAVNWSITEHRTEMSKNGCDGQREISLIKEREYVVHRSLHSVHLTSQPPPVNFNPVRRAREVEISKMRHVRKGGQPIV